MQKHPIEVNPLIVLPSHITIAIHQDDADRLSNGLSDLLCWCRGFMAGREDFCQHPQGTEAATILNLALKRALTKSQAKA
jgi:hypothetical protein